MSTTQVPFERRAAQRFDFQIPVSVRQSTSGDEGVGFTQDLSARGMFFFSDMPLVEGTTVEVTFTLPSEITLAEEARVRCQARILRVEPAGGNQKTFGAAAHLQSYEYLPAVDSAGTFERTPQLHTSGSAI